MAGLFWKSITQEQLQFRAPTKCTPAGWTCRNSSETGRFVGIAAFICKRTSPQWDSIAIECGCPKSWAKAEEPVGPGEWDPQTALKSSVLKPQSCPTLGQTGRKIPHSLNSHLALEARGFHVSVNNMKVLHEHKKVLPGQFMFSLPEHKCRDWTGGLPARCHPLITPTIKTKMTH